MQEMITQADKFSQALKMIKADVTAEDRTMAQEKFEISNASVTRYLDGDVRNNDLAADLLTFFKARIAKRDKALS